MSMRSEFETFLTITGNISPLQAAVAWANAYDGYAKTCKDALGNGVSGVNKQDFQDILEEDFNYFIDNPTATSHDCQPAITDAVKAYWAGATITSSSLPPGAASAISNVLVGTPGSVSFPTSWSGVTPAIGADRISTGLEDATEAQATLFSYIDGGGNPGTYSSSLR